MTNMLVSFGIKNVQNVGSKWPWQVESLPLASVLRFWNTGGAWNDANAEAYESL